MKKNNQPEKIFEFVYTNATSLNNKILQLELYIRCNRWTHGVSIADTWFSETSVPTIGWYVMYRRDKYSTHGGVCIYVRNNVKTLDV